MFSIYDEKTDIFHYLTRELLASYELMKDHHDFNIIKHENFENILHFSEVFVS